MAPPWTPNALTASRGEQGLLLLAAEGQLHELDGEGALHPQPVGQLPGHVPVARTGHPAVRLREQDDVGLRPR